MTEHYTNVVYLMAVVKPTDILPVCERNWFILSTDGAVGSEIIPYCMLNKKTTFIRFGLIKNTFYTPNYC